MKKLCLISSYGGSGSTFLVHQLMKATHDYEFVHSHAVPREGRVGLPVFNKITGHNEGPFSNHFELPNDAKILIIYRDPAKAYKSRCSLKHYCHIWSESQKFVDELGVNFRFDEASSRKKFNLLWKERKETNQDVLSLSYFLSLWKEYALSGKHEVAFVRYEELGDCNAEIQDFLDINNIDLSSFKISEREVDESIKLIFKEPHALQHFSKFEAFSESKSFEKRLPNKFKINFLFIICEDELYEKITSLVCMLEAILGCSITVKSTGNTVLQKTPAHTVSNLIYNILYSPADFDEMHNIYINELGENYNTSVAFLNNFLRWTTNL